MARNTGEFVSLGASNDQLKAKLRETTTLMVGSTKEWQQALDGVGTHGQSAFGKLEEGMKTFKREQVQQGKLVGFYMRELHEFIPLGGEARSAVSGLAQMLVEGASSGMGFGLAFEAVKFAAVGVKIAVNALTEGAKTDLDKLKESAKDIFREIDQLGMAALDKKFLNKLLDNKEYIAAQDTVMARAVELGKQKEYVDAEMAKNPSLERQIELNQSLDVTQGAYDKAAVRVRELTDANIKLKNQAKGAFKEMSGGNSHWGADSTEPAPGLPGVKQAKKAADTYWEVWSKAIKDHRNDYEAWNQNAGNGSLPDGAAIWQSKQLAKSAKPMPYMSAGQDPRDKAEVEQVNAQISRQQDLLKQTAQTWQSYGEQVGTVLGAMAEGTASWGDLFAEVLKQVMTALYQYAVSAIMKQAGVAAANTMEENSKAGPWGWMVGLGAMGAVFAAVMGLVGKIGSAEGGAELPAFSGGRLMQLHTEELVLPRYYKAGLRSLIDNQQQGGGRGGSITNVHYNVATMDSKSFDEWYQRSGAGDKAIRYHQSQASR